MEKFVPRFMQRWGRRSRKSGRAALVLMTLVGALTLPVSASFAQDYDGYPAHYGHDYRPPPPPPPPEYRGGRGYWDDGHRWRQQRWEAARRYWRHERHERRERARDWYYRHH